LALAAGVYHFNAARAAKTDAALRLNSSAVIIRFIMILPP
jgi:hypothetical protein